MVVFPHAKINIGLYITEKRADGFHNLETLFFPVLGLCDALEFVQSDAMQCTVTGTNLQIADKDNIVMKAYQMLLRDFPLPPLHIHLQKNIPHGAGMGGGSADAAFMIKALNEKFQLDLSLPQMIEYAAALGSDCPYFLYNTPCIGKGRGEILEEFPLSMPNYYIAILKPELNISTAEAFKGIQPKALDTPLQDLLLQPITSWKETIHNQFEDSLFPQYPILSEMKEYLYASGARYASLSGSGSVVYGIFTQPMPLQMEGVKVWWSRAV
jgi:4-diphosphocytidyl-2-C-methyl-D-erythritol kinase